MTRLNRADAAARHTFTRQGHKRLDRNLGQGSRIISIENGVSPMAIDVVRHRDKNGEIGRKVGNTLIGTLRKTYGSQFAEGCRNDERLSDVLHKMDEPSLSMVLHDYQQGWLEGICRPAT